MRFKLFRTTIAAAALGLPALLTLAGGAAAPAKTPPTLDQRYAASVRPMLQTYCVSCHGKTGAQAQLDLTAFTNEAAVAKELPRWSLLMEKLEAKQMPPAGAKPLPAALRAEAVAWIRDARRFESDRNAGDPGPMAARRLSNSEYDYTIRDLTGQDLRPTREFPVDPANEEGFDNSGETLTLSGALMKKYLQAARDIADHAALCSTGIVFAPDPVLVETDRDKFAILRIVDFYKRQPTDFADYFQAAWQYRYRAALGRPKATLQSIATEDKVSPRYLDTIWKTLNAPGEKLGPMATLQAKWNSLPAPKSSRASHTAAGVPYAPPAHDGPADASHTPPSVSNAALKYAGGQGDSPAGRMAGQNGRTGIAQLPNGMGGQPAPTHTAGADEVRAACEDMRDWTIALRRKLASHFDNLRVPRGFSNGGQCFVLWKDEQYAQHRRTLNPAGLQIGGVPATHTVQRRRGSRQQQQQPEPVVVSDPVDQDLFVPEAVPARAPYLASLEQFCSVFPDAFFVSERGRMFVDEPGDKGRLLTAGLHNSMGVFRDDQPLMELILDENGRRELDSMWQDFDMVAFIPERMHAEFFVYERAEASTITDVEFNFARAEDKEALSDAKIKLLGDLYLAKAIRNGADELAQKAIVDHFAWVSKTIRGAERERLAAEPIHLKSLVDFAQRAYRRPLTDAERASILAFYQTLRTKEGLTHEDAIRDSLVGILMSPNFLFRLDLDDDMPSGRPSPSHTTAECRGPSVAVDVASMALETDTDLSPRRRTSSLQQARTSVPRPAAPSGLQPLTDYALASRLSYFLWASMPDKELLAHAAAGDLHKPEVLTAQARRMLHDPRTKALAVEFGGNWLDFRRFEEHNAVDRNRFPSFNDDLRESMYQEPVHYLMDVFQNDRPVLDLLYSKRTFVNAALARHYGMTGVKTSGADWVRVDDADKYGRGGLLPMAVFLTKNSPGLRTSPVKRGYWVVKRVLGETIPPPPANVPALPADESKMGNLTLRQALAAHRENPACAGCHARFDSYGLVFEGYGPIGEIRAKDLGGKPVDARAPFPGVADQTGVSGLEDFIKLKRQKDFLDNFGRKLLSYALGRSLQPSDDSTLAAIQNRLAATDYRFDTIVDNIVTSRQFRYRRMPGVVATN